MQYFTKEEAYKIKATLDKYVGQTMKYEPEQVGKVLEIAVQETGHEISNYGNVENGFLVVVQFDKHSGLVPALFCDFNSIDPIYATHQVLNAGTKNQLISNRAMLGKWKYEGKEGNLTITIDKNVKIEGEILGQKELAEFSASGHWLSYFVFMFMDSHYYILESSDDKNMVFGKLVTARTIDGKWIWKLKFNRAD